MPDAHDTQQSRRPKTQMEQKSTGAAIAPKHMGSRGEAVLACYHDCRQDGTKSSPVCGAHTFQHLPSGKQKPDREHAHPQTHLSKDDGVLPKGEVGPVDELVSLHSQGLRQPPEPRSLRDSELVAPQPKVVAEGKQVIRLRHVCDLHAAVGGPLDFSLCGTEPALLYPILCKEGVRCWERMSSWVCASQRTSPLENLWRW